MSIHRDRGMMGKNILWEFREIVRYKFGFVHPIQTSSEGLLREEYVQSYHGGRCIQRHRREDAVEIRVNIVDTELMIFHKSQIVCPSRTLDVHPALYQSTISIHDTTHGKTPTREEGLS